MLLIDSLGAGERRRCPGDPGYPGAPACRERKPLDCPIEKLVRRSRAPRQLCSEPLTCLENPGTNRL